MVLATKDQCSETIGNIDRFRVTEFCSKGQIRRWKKSHSRLRSREPDNSHDLVIYCDFLSKMTTSADEHSALKRNSVHQTRLSLELQQLEKDKSIRLREMQKASQVFARRHEQIQGIRDKACLRRVTSAPAKNTFGKPLRSGSIPSGEALEEEWPFVTKTAKLESDPHKGQLKKTMTMPSLSLLPSRRSSTQFSSASVGNPAQKRATAGTTRLGFETPLDEKPANSTRVPMYSRNFSGLRQRGESHPSKQGVQFCSAERNRRDSVP